MPLSPQTEAALAKELGQGDLESIRRNSSAIINAAIEKTPIDLEAFYGESEETLQYFFQNPQETGIPNITRDRLITAYLAGKMIVEAKKGPSSAMPTDRRVPPPRPAAPVPPVPGAATSRDSLAESARSRQQFIDPQLSSMRPTTLDTSTLRRPEEPKKEEQGSSLLGRLSGRNTKQPQPPTATGTTTHLDQLRRPQPDTQLGRGGSTTPPQTTPGRPGMQPQNRAQGRVEEVLFGTDRNRALASDRKEAINRMKQFHHSARTGVAGVLDFAVYMARRPMLWQEAFLINGGFKDWWHKDHQAFEAKKQTARHQNYTHIQAITQLVLFGLELSGGFAGASSVIHKENFFDTLKYIDFNAVRFCAEALLPTAGEVIRQISIGTANVGMKALLVFRDGPQKTLDDTVNFLGNISHTFPAVWSQITQYIRDFHMQP